MKKGFYSILFLMLFVGFAVEAAAGVPEGYYKNADGKKKSALKLAMKAIVSEGTTRLVNEKGFEAHKRFIDIQLALRGTELIRCKPLEFVKETIPYNPEKDAARYADEPGLDAVIGNGYFLVVFPDDAHEPLLAVDGNPELVKKVVLKVPVE